MAKSLDQMTKSELTKAYDKAFAKCSAITTALIEAGRGNETGSDIRAQADDLSLAYIAAQDVFDAIVAEERRRKWYHGSLDRIIRKAA